MSTFDFLWQLVANHGDVEMAEKSATLSSRTGLRYYVKVCYIVAVRKVALPKM